MQQIPEGKHTFRVRAVEWFTNGKGKKYAFVDLEVVSSSTSTYVQYTHIEDDMTEAQFLCERVGKEVFCVAEKDDDEIMLSFCAPAAPASTEMIEGNYTGAVTIAEAQVATNGLSVVRKRMNAPVFAVALDLVRMSVGLAQTAEDAQGGDPVDDAELEETFGRVFLELCTLAVLCGVKLEPSVVRAFNLEAEACGLGRRL